MRLSAPAVSLAHRSRAAVVPVSAGRPQRQRRKLHCKPAQPAAARGRRPARNLLGGSAGPQRTAAAESEPEASQDGLAAGDQQATPPETDAAAPHDAADPHPATLQSSDARAASLQRVAPRGAGGRQPLKEVSTTESDAAADAASAGEAADAQDAHSDSAASASKEPVHGGGGGGGGKLALRGLAKLGSANKGAKQAEKWSKLLGGSDKMRMLGAAETIMASAEKKRAGRVAALQLLEEAGAVAKAREAEEAEAAAQAQQAKEAAAAAQPREAEEAEAAAQAQQAKEAATAAQAQQAKEAEAAAQAQQAREAAAAAQDQQSKRAAAAAQAQQEREADAAAQQATEAKAAAQQSKKSAAKAQTQQDRKAAAMLVARREMTKPSASVSAADAHRLAAQAQNAAAKALDATAQAMAAAMAVAAEAQTGAQPRQEPPPAKRLKRSQRVTPAAADAAVQAADAAGRVGDAVEVVAEAPARAHQAADDPAETVTPMLNARPAGRKLQPVVVQRNGGSGGARRNGGSEDDGDVEQDDFGKRQHRIHVGLMKKWHGFEKQRMPAELQNAAMRATLKRSLRAQRRLNKSADAAAIAAGFEPPSASSWTVRFRQRRDAMKAHYMQQMARISAAASSVRMAENRSIPAVCTALAGARLLHLELEVEARELGVAVPEHLTLDSQWDRDDAASGQQQEAAPAAPPPPEPRSLLDEIGGVARAAFGQYAAAGRRKEAEKAAAAAAQAAGVRVVHESQGGALQREFTELLKEAATESQRYSHMYDSWRAAREIRDAVAKTEKMRQSSGGRDAAPPQVSAVASGRGGGSAQPPAQPPAQPLTVEAAVEGSMPSTAPSTGSLLRRMLSAFTGSKAGSDAEAASASAGAAALPASPGVPVTSGGGVVFRGAAPEATAFGAGVGKRRHKAMLDWKERTVEQQLPSFAPSRQREQELWQLGYRRVAGIDDSGAGSAAGPIVAAACLMPLDVNIRGVRDSKVLSAAEREEVFRELISHPRVAFSTYIVEAFVIDEVGCSAANMVAMAGAWRNLAAADPDFVLVDGAFLPGAMQQPAAMAISHSDSSDYIVAAASIIATVTRGRIMEEYARHWPQYGFDKNYGHVDSEVHRAGLQAYGASPVHRARFGVWSQSEMRSKLDPRRAHLPGGSRWRGGDGAVGRESSDEE